MDLGIWDLLIFIHKNDSSMILVTGGTGLIGAHLILELASRGFDVRALRRSGSKVWLVNRLLQHHSGNGESLQARIHWINGDILDIRSLDEAMVGVHDVYHCAGMVSFNPRNGRKMIWNNMQGTANMVNMGLAKNVRKFCHVSSVISLSKTMDNPVITESSPWKSPRHHPPYAISKVESEREVWRGIAEGLNAVIVNPGIVIGYGDPMRDSGRLIHSLSNISRFYTSGVTGMVGINDVVRAMILLMESDISGERFILSAENVPYKKLTEMVATTLGKPKPSVRIPSFALELAWRMEHIRCLLAGGEPFITKATAQSARRKVLFDGSRITRTIPFQYTPIETVVQQTCLMHKDS